MFPVTVTTTTPATATTVVIVIIIGSNNNNNKNSSSSSTTTTTTTTNASHPTACTSDVPCHQTQVDEGGGVRSRGGGRENMLRRSPVSCGFGVALVVDPHLLALLLQLEGGEDHVSDCTMTAEAALAFRQETLFQMVVRAVEENASDDFPGAV
ncbi:hypothetical protein SprV_ctg1302918100 [Sparganum proliferum]